MSMKPRSNHAAIAAAGGVKGAMQILAAVPADLDTAAGLGELVLTPADREQLRRLTLELSAKTHEVVGLLTTIHANQPFGD